MEGSDKGEGVGGDFWVAKYQCLSYRLGSFNSSSDSQPWPHIRISQGSFKNPEAQYTSDQFHQDPEVGHRLQYCLQFLGTAECAAGLENY